MNKKKKEVINGFWNQNFKYMDTIVTVDKETVFNIFYHDNPTHRHYTGNGGTPFLLEPLTQPGRLPRYPLWVPS